MLGFTKTDCSFLSKATKNIATVCTAMIWTACSNNWSIPCSTGQLRKFDLNPAGSSDPSLLLDPVFEDLLLYRELRSNGVEIFAYDPATSRVREVVDVNPDGDATPWRFTRFDDRLFFVAAGADGFRVFTLERQLPPVATNDTAATYEDFAVAIDDLANDLDPNDDSLSVTAVAQPANGSVALNADGTLTYTSDTDFHGSDSFIYTIDDGHCGTSTATVNVTVQRVAKRRNSE